MNYNDRFTQGSVFSALIRFAIPVMLANILQIFYSATDLLVLGHFAQTADVSGVTTSSQLMQLITVGLSGLSAGFVVVLGQFSGEKNEKDLAASIGTAAVLFGAISLVLTVLAISLTGPLVSLMRTPSEAVGPAKEYLAICGGGIVFIVGYNVTSCIFRGIGNSKAPLLFVAIATGINIALDLLFIKGFNMGARGAAIATVTAQAMSLLFSLVYLKRRGLGFPIALSDIKLHKRLARKIIKLGAPLSLQEMLVTFSFLLITAVVNKLGVVISASVGVVEKLIGFLMMPSSAFSTAVATVAAHNFGAGKSDRARKSMWAGIFTSLVFGVVATAGSWLFTENLTALFSNDTDVIKNAALYLRSYSLDCMLVAFIFTMNGYFNACNHSVFTMAHSLAATFVLRVPLTIILAGIKGTTLFHIGIATPASSVLSLVLCLWYLSRSSRNTVLESQHP